MADKKGEIKIIKPHFGGYLKPCEKCGNKALQTAIKDYENYAAWIGYDCTVCGQEYRFK